MTRNSAYLPDSGDIVWLFLDPTLGHEQSGRRPALVLTSRVFTMHTGLAVICPITSKIKGKPFEIVLERTKTHGAVLPIHVRSVDIVARKLQFIERVPDAILEKTVQAVKVIIARDRLRVAV